MTAKRIEIPAAKAAAGGAPYEERQLQQTQKAVKSPPPPAAYGGLRLGPELSIELEAVQALPVSMEQSLLRNLSPFMVQVEPPMVFAGDAGFTNKPRGSLNPALYGEAGNTSVTAYQAARSKLSQTGIVGISYQAQSSQEYVAQNAISRTAQKAANGTLTDVDGTGTQKYGHPAIADLYTAVDIAQQLSAILNTPPLVLLINPQNLQIAYTKIQQYTDRSRHGYIFHVWGEDQPRLSITARCGAFVSGGRGVQFASKRDSKAWQNLMTAFHFYKNNGYIYDTVGKSNAHLFVGALSIHYDGWVYYGNMESFSFTYEEEKQHGGMEFSMEFVVSAISDTAQPSFYVAPMKAPTPSLSDPRYIRDPSQRGHTGAGVYSVDLFTRHPNVTEQGRVVAGYSGSTVQMASAERKTELGPSTSGFQSRGAQEETRVAQVRPGDALVEV